MEGTTNGLMVIKIDLLLIDSLLPRTLLRTGTSLIKNWNYPYDMPSSITLPYDMPS